MDDGLLRELQDAIGDTYAIERELGGGGMSHVFLATERSLGRRVVIKLLPPELVSGVSEARFQREILVTANLQHPHILPVLAVGTNRGLHYYVAPYIEGQSLRDRLALQGALPVSDALDILRELASALAHAHANGVIHRDVKPENVLLSGGHVVLADFGIAGAIQRVTQAGRLTVTGQGPGTPGYMAPEQLVDSATADARADVFALGVVAYEMLVGKAPFSGSTPHALAASYFRNTPPSVTQIRSDVPVEVATAISRALSTAPEERYATAGEFLAAIRTPQASLRSRAGRRRGILIAAGVLVVAAVAAAVTAPRLFGDGAADGDATDRKMIAVLPFKNLGPAEDAYFADGVTEEVTSHLATVSGLGVISRTSADQYANSAKTLKAIARELGADYVLEGSVRWDRAGTGPGRVRVTPQLIRVRDDTHLWAEQYDAELQDVFTVQSNIAERVADALAIALPGAQRQQMSARPTEKWPAYDAYMRGEQLLTREGSNPTSLPRAEKLLREATSADPRFAVAFAKLALVDVFMYLSFLDRTESRLRAARAAADSALALDPSLPEAHHALGRYLEATDDLDGAAAQYAIAEKGRPNDSVILTASAEVLARRGAWTEAVNRFRRIAELDPRSVDANLGAATVLGLTRDYRDAHAFAERAIAADSDAIAAHILKARLELFVAGDWTRARATVRSILLRFGAERSVATEGFALVTISLDTADLATLERVPSAAFGGNPVLFHFWRIELFERWQPNRARAHADSLNRAGQFLLRGQPNSFRVHAANGYVNAMLGNRELAIQEARRALELAPRSRDTAAWAEVAWMSARIFHHLGETDSAVDQLEQLLSGPSWVSAAYLGTDSLWTPLKKNPRFQQLLARSATN